MQKEQVKPDPNSWPQLDFKKEFEKFIVKIQSEINDIGNEELENLFKAVKEKIIAAVEELESFPDNRLLVQEIHFVNNLRSGSEWSRTAEVVAESLSKFSSGFEFLREIIKLGRILRKKKRWWSYIKIF